MSENYGNLGRTKAIIDLSALTYNLQSIRKHLPENTLLTAVVKANAYGHGVEGLYPTLKAGGVDRYAVAFWQEGAHLREIGVTEPILILGETVNEEMEALVDYDLIGTIYTVEMARALEQVCAKRNVIRKIHLKLDTGMGRIGFPCTEAAADRITEIASMEHLQMEGIFSHFAKADEFNKDYTAKQYKAYETMIGYIEKRGLHIPIHHIDNSAAIMEMQHPKTNMVRAGIILYGLYPSDEVDRNQLDLKPVLRWVSHLSHVKEVPAGTPLSYGGTFVTNRPSRIGTVPVGYADGYNRLLSNRGAVLIHGVEAPICGRVCMDQFMVDLTDVPEAERGDEVILLGDSMDADRMAGLLSTINYEILCDISYRVPRVYCQDGKSML